jgi:putative ATP-grasp target RiPP
MAATLSEDAMASVDASLDANPLSSAHVRYTVRQHVASAAPGPVATRPFGLRFAAPVPAGVVKTFTYCPEQQVAVDAEGRPLIETMGKEWKTKAQSDGDEGSEEDWGWEES